MAFFNFISDFKSKYNESDNRKTGVSRDIDLERIIFPNVRK